MFNFNLSVKIYRSIDFMKTLDLIFFGLKGKINGAKALKELESLGVIKGNKIVYDDNDKILEAKIYAIIDKYFGQH